MEADLERLTDLLGDDHDLAVLLARLNEDAALTTDLNPEGVFQLIHRERQEMQEEAITLGREFFAPPSTEFLAYIDSVWGDGDTF